MGSRKDRSGGGAAAPTPTATAGNYHSNTGRSGRVVRQKLGEKGFGDGEIEATISSLSSNGYLDDEVFARDRCETRIRNKLWGPLKISSELRSKGVAPEIVKKVLGGYGDDEEAKTALAALEGWARKHPDAIKPGAHTKFDAAARAARHLAGRGFTGGAAAKAIDEFFSDPPNSEQGDSG